MEEFFARGWFLARQPYLRGTRVKCRWFYTGEICIRSSGCERNRLADNRRRTPGPRGKWASDAHLRRAGRFAKISPVFDDRRAARSCSKGCRRGTLAGGSALNAKGIAPQKRRWTLPAR